MKNSNKKGFTLVELSIVLVIIGLLIGGILVGQSLIESAKMQSLVRQLGQYDAAVATFKDKFGALPGDSGLFAGTIVGDADGIVDVTGAVAAGTTWAGETAEVWVQLSASGLKNEDGTAFISTAPTAGLMNNGTRIPKSKAGASTAGILVVGDGDLAALDLTSNANAYVIADCTDMSSTTLDCQGALNGPDAIALDSKLDDGVGTTGNVVGVLGTTDLVTWVTIADGNEAAYTATATANDTNVMIVRIGSTSGVLE
jgi:prepilin-type N-terminal cleavage/methylation domain-containing protein